MSAEPALLPSRNDEAWRYADMDALAQVWPLAEPERIVVAPGGEFARALVLEGSGVTQIQIALEAGAAASFHIVDVGAGYGRCELEVTLADDAAFSLGAVQLAGGGQTREIVTTIIHRGESARSSQIMRSIVGAGASGNMLGQIKVERGAQRTDASQSMRAMLLSPTASANAKPELEIFADDVKCAHGCAVGELDAMGLFYLQSRGIPPQQARSLMLQAFIAEALVGAGDEEQLLQAALAHLEVLETSLETGG